MIRFNGCIVELVMGKVTQLKVIEPEFRNFAFLQIVSKTVDLKFKVIWQTIFFGTETGGRRSYLAEVKFFLKITNL